MAISVQGKLKREAMHWFWILFKGFADFWVIKCESCLKEKAFFFPISFPGSPDRQRKDGGNRASPEAGLY